MMSGITDEGSKQNDPAFKLFGRTIKKTENSVFVPLENDSLSSFCFKDAEDAVPESPGATADRGNALDEHGSSLESNDQCSYAENPISRGVDIPSSSIHAHEECHGDVAHVNSEDHADKALKRPDKPVLCPRCKSLDTKFCYYNNYNVNQPRHFCKHCHRYWTAGGSLRNVPVGAGRRKNKHSVVLHQGSFPPDGMVVRGDPPDRAKQVLACSGVGSPLSLNKHINIRQPSSSPKHLEACSLARALDSPSSSTVLSFRGESRLTGSTYALNQEVLQGYTQELSHEERIHLRVEADICPRPLAYVNPHLHMPVDMGGSKASDGKNSQETIPSRTANRIGHESMQEPVGKSVSTHVGSQMPILFDSKPASATSNDMPNHDAALGWAPNDHGAHGWAPRAPFPFLGGPWQYAGLTNPPTPTALATALQGVLNPYSNTICVNSARTAATCLNQPPWSGALGAFWAGFPWHLMQNPLWGPLGSWTTPWAPAAAAAAIAATAAAAGNPMLASSATGKREREQEHPADREQQGSLLVPKLLRIDDPGEAVLSSIRATLGIDKRSDSFGSGGLFGAFLPKAESEGDDTHVQAWYSNPAAMTRSVAFQERATQNVNVHGE